MSVKEKKHLADLDLLEVQERLKLGDCADSTPKKLQELHVSEIKERLKLDDIGGVNDEYMEVIEAFLAYYPVIVPREPDVVIRDLARMFKAKATRDLCDLASDFVWTLREAAGSRPDLDAVVNRRGPMMSRQRTCDRLADHLFRVATEEKRIAQEQAAKDASE